MNPRTLFRLALLQLGREGRRTVLGAACIAFGVMTLVAMQLLSGAMTDALNVPPRVALGGDVELSRERGPLTAADTALLARLQRSGALQAVTLVAQPGGTFLRREGSGRVFFLNRVLAVEPARWPLVGAMPALDGAPWPTALAETTDALVTRDLALKSGLHVDERFTVASANGGQVRTYRLRAIAPALPDQRGATVLVRRGAHAPTAALVTRPTPAAVRTLERAGLHADRPEPLEGQSIRLMRAVLVGAGLLGLALGGLGIANMVVVTLARRRRELATLAALGYGPGVRVALLTCELALVGLLGGLVGSGLGVVVAAGLARLLGPVSTFTLVLRVPPGLLAAGALIGMVAAALFGAAAVLRAAAVRPAVALRELPVAPPRWMAVRSALVGFVPLVAFAGLAGLVLRSALQGALVVVGGVGAMALLAGAMLLLLQPLVRLPVPGVPLLRLAQRALRGTGLRTGFALAALFAGTYAVGLAGLMFANGADQLRARSGSGADLYVLGAEEADVRQAFAVLAPESVHVQLQLDVPLGPRTGRMHTFRLIARPGDAPGWDVTRVAGTLALSEAPGALPEVLVPVLPDSAVHPGDTLLARPGGKAVPMRVTGTYRAAQMDPILGAGFSGIVAPAVLRALGTPRTVAGATGPGVGTREATARVGAALPRAFVFLRDDFVEAMDGLFRALLRFAQALAALALGTGVVLIANAVALVLLERRREFGVLQAVGYGRRHVLGALVAEHALLGLVSGLAAVGSVVLTAHFLNARFPVAALHVSAAQALELIAMAVFLAAATATLVAWGPLRARPLEALRTD